MDENPWDYWLRTNVLFEAKVPQDERAEWRQKADELSNRYQRAYAIRWQVLNQKTLTDHTTSFEYSWWAPFVSQNKATWDYLEQITHPLDSGPEELLRLMPEAQPHPIETDD